MPSPQETDRARGVLYGLAIGDALGMPTQLLSRQEITGRWGCGTCASACLDALAAGDPRR